MVSDNPLELDEAREARIRERAYLLWEEEGRPHGRDVDYWERARELVGMEESMGSGLKQEARRGPTGGVVEEAEVQENLGEFPGPLTDQGDRPQTPARKRRRAKS